MTDRLQVAVLDMYDGEPNQGMRCILDILDAFGEFLQFTEYDVRGKAQIPGLEYDIYISSGGPGDPRVGDGNWDAKYYALLDKIWNWNSSDKLPKKHVFFICHSFQMACNHFNVAQVTERKSMSFGTFPVHKVEAGFGETIFEGLSNPFYVADFRSYQVVEPDRDRMAEMGAQILALEKERPHIPLERAIMGIRFSDEMVGVQFHPEADSGGMLMHFLNDERREHVFEKHGEERYWQLLEDLRDPDKIHATQQTIIPTFLRRAIYSIAGISVGAFVPVM